MPEPGHLTQRLASAADVARTPAADPADDVRHDSLVLPHGRIEFVRPRSAMDLLLAQDFDDDEQPYPPYWAELWPSGVELARDVAGDVRPGAAVLEIGCGLGLPAISAALCGARVLATDRSADAIAFTDRNARLSGATLTTAVLSYTDDELVARGPWDLVLAADVLYNEQCVDELLTLLPRLLANGGEIRIADPDRPQAAGFLAAVRRDGYAVGVTPTSVPGVTIVRIARR